MGDRTREEQGGFIRGGRPLVKRRVHPAQLKSKPTIGLHTRRVQTARFQPHAEAAFGDSVAFCSIYQTARNPLIPLTAIDVQMPNRQSAIPILVASSDEAADSVVGNSDRGELPRPVLPTEIVEGKTLRYGRIQRDQSKAHFVGVAICGVDLIGGEAGVQARYLLRILRHLCFANNDHVP